MLSYPGAPSVDLEARRKAEEDRKAAEPIPVEEDGGSRLFYLQARAALTARRFDDMVGFVTKLAELDNQPARDERNMLAIAYKTVVGRLRGAWQVLVNSSHPSDEVQEEIATMRAQVEDEIREHCTRLVTLIEEHLIPVDKMPLGRVFFLKLAGDFTRYVCEISVGDERHEQAMVAERYYQLAREAASQAKIPVTSVVRLGLELNLALFYAEVRGQTREALAVAQEAFELAMTEVTTLKNPEYSDATRLLALLQDNIKVWGAESSGGDDASDGRRDRSDSGAGVATEVGRVGDPL